MFTTKIFMMWSRFSLKLFVANLTKHGIDFSLEMLQIKWQLTVWLQKL